MRWRTCRGGPFGIANPVYIQTQTLVEPPTKGSTMGKCNVDYCLNPTPSHKRYCEWHDALTEVSP